jgi:hypothetical protein
MRLYTDNEHLEQGPTLDMPWLLAGSFIVLIAGFAFVILSISFFAGTGDVRFLGDVAAFVLIFAVIIFAILLFVAANDAEPDTGLEPAEIAEGDAVSETTAETGACTACGRVNPAGANFCYHCGSPLSSRS